MSTEVSDKYDVLTIELYMDSKNGSSTLLQNVVTFCTPDLILILELQWTRSVLALRSVTIQASQYKKVGVLSRFMKVNVSVKRFLFSVGSTIISKNYIKCSVLRRQCSKYPHLSHI